MLIDGLRLSDTGVISNAKVQHGPAFPSVPAPTAGAMFYLDAPNGAYGVGLYVYNGANWVTGDVTAIEAGHGLVGGGTSGDVALAVDTSIVAQKSDLDATSAEIAAHAADANLHLSVAQNTLLDGLASTLTATELNYVDGVTSPIQGQIDAEAASRTSGDSALDGKIAAETTRAQTAESSLQTSLNDEVSRAQLAESNLSTAIDNERIRATAEESTINLKVDNEITNRIAGDNALSADITNVTGTHDLDKAAQETRDANQDLAIAAKVSKAGDTMSGVLNMSANRIISLGTPIDPEDAANKGYVDARVTGLRWKNPVRAINLISQELQVPPAAAVKGDTYIVKGPASGGWSAFSGGDVVQYVGGDVTLASSWVLVQQVVNGDRFVVAATTTTAPDVALVKNDIVTWERGVFTAESPVDSTSLYVSDADAIEFGQSFVYQADLLKWVQFTGPAQVGAGIGLTYEGNTLNVGLGAGIKELPADEVGIDALATGGLFTTVDGVNASTDAAAQLAIKLDGPTLSLSGLGLKVATSVTDDITNINAKVDAETSARIAADNDLSADISNERLLREAADTTLSNDIAAETSRAQSAETSISTDVANVSASLSSHAADAALHLTAAQNTLLDGLVTTLTAAELNYVDGVTAPIQGQIDTANADRIAGDNALQANITAEANARKAADDTLQANINTVSTNLSSHTADATLHLTAAQNALLDGLAPTLTATELNYVDGVTGPIQAQLDSLAGGSSGLANHEANTSLHLTAAQNTLLDGLATTLTATELNYVDGVTGPIQTQLNDKGSLSAGNTWSGVQTFNSAVGIGGNANVIGLFEMFNKAVIRSAQPTFELLDSDEAANRQRWQITANGGNLSIFSLSDAGAMATGIQFVRNATTHAIDSAWVPEVLRSTGTSSVYWHAGNDGASSGLDADLLDGQQGAFYQNAANLNAGTLPAARLPTTGIAAGTYTKLTVDTSGRASAGTTLAETDIPNISFSKVINRPTTLSGYGITDGAALAANNTWSGTNTWSAAAQFNSVVSIQSFAPLIDFVETSEAVGGKKWRMRVDGPKMDLSLMSDDNSVQVPVFEVTRSGTTVSEFKFAIAPKVGANAMWHAGNDGANSGLDADLLDGLHASAFATAAHTHAISEVTGLQTALDARILSTEKGAANGVATLGADGKVPAAQLPSYVDDVLEYASLANFPATGSTGSIYVAIDTNKIYRWSGSTYIEISASAGTSDTATKLATAREIAATGDATWSVTFDGSANVSGALALAATGVAAGQYSKVTVDAKGRVTAGGNVTASDFETYRSLSTNGSAQKGQVIFVDTSANTVMLALPSSPVMGDTIEIIDGAGTFFTNNLTIARNGNNIMGLAEDLIVSDNFAAFKLRYYNAQHGWRVIGA